MTKEDDKRKGGVNIEVPAGQLKLTGYPAGVLIQASSTAVQSLSAAFTLASSTGYGDIATATEGVQVQFQQIFHITGGNVTINQPQTITVTQQSITEVENQVNHLTNTLETNAIPFFDCKSAFDQCMNGAAGKGAQLHCRVLYASCLAQRVSSTLSPFTK